VPAVAAPAHAKGLANAWTLVCRAVVQRVRRSEVAMEKKLRRLETFFARGDDGKTYAVEAYEHLARVDAFVDPHGHWEPIGVAEYRLADGRHVRVDPDGAMVVDDSGVRLQPQR
jgi:hypothetical protein